MQQICLGLDGGKSEHWACAVTADREVVRNKLLPNDEGKLVKMYTRLKEHGALDPDRSLAEHYDPLAMDPVLIAAHERLDRVVDKAFGATKALSTNEERQAILFQRYQEMASGD